MVCYRTTGETAMSYELIARLTLAGWLFAIPYGAAWLVLQ